VSQSSVAEYSSLLRGYYLSAGKWLPTFLGGRSALLRMFHHEDGVEKNF